MKTCLHVVIAATILCITQVVAAGVVMVLGGYLPDVGADHGGALVAWITIMAVATWCAVCFLEGAVAQAKRFATWRLS